MQSVPFVFDFDGVSAQPVFKPVVSHHAVEVLKQYTPQTTDERAAIDAVLSALPQLLLWRVNGFKSLKSGDISDHNKSTWTENEILHPRIRPPQLYYGTICPGDLRTKFSPEHGLPIGPHPQQWGWGCLNTILEHASVVNKIAKKLDITFSTTLLKSAQQCSDSLGDTLRLRTPDALNDYGRTYAYALYVPGRGYIDGQNYHSTLDRARLFPNANVEQPGAVVVQVEIAVTKVCTPTTDPALGVVINALEKQRLETALKTAEADVLRARLRELGYDTIEQAPPKRKM